MSRCAGIEPTAGLRADVLTVSVNMHERLPASERSHPAEDAAALSRRLLCHAMCFGSSSLTRLGEISRPLQERPESSTVSEARANGKKADAVLTKGLLPP